RHYAHHAHLHASPTRRSPDLGMVVATGTPEEIAQVPESHTGRFLRMVLERDRARAVNGNATADGTANGALDSADAGQRGRKARSGESAAGSEPLAVSGGTSG